jgi:hypothetical protein
MGVLNAVAAVGTNGWKYPGSEYFASVNIINIKDTAKQTNKKELVLSYCLLFGKV